MSVDMCDHPGYTCAEANRLPTKEGAEAVARYLADRPPAPVVPEMFRGPNWKKD